MFQTLARVTAIIGLTCSLSLHAAHQVVKEVVVQKKESNYSPTGLYTGIYGGYSSIQGMIDSDGRGVQGRFSLGYESPSWESFVFGVEVGFQSGNQMRVNAKQSVINQTGNLPVEVTLKPFIDCLATAKFQLMDSSPLSLVMKGGFAYQQLQLNNRLSTQKNLDKINGELHAGFSYQLSPNARFVTYYQGIYTTNSAGVDMVDNKAITIKRIPTQHGGFMGIEFTL